MGPKTIEDIRYEYRTFISGRTLNEYLTCSRIGAHFAMTRKMRKELFQAIKVMREDKDWGAYLEPGNTDLSSLAWIEDKIFERSETWYMEI